VKLDRTPPNMFAAVIKCATHAHGTRTPQHSIHPVSKKALELPAFVITNYN
jgi:hypothetical protein